MSLTLSTCGGKTRRRGRTASEPVPRPSESVAVEAMTRRLHRLRGPRSAELPARKDVDRALEEPDGRAERPGDEVELVLDDQVGRAQPAHSRDLCRGIVASVRGLGVMRCRRRRHWRRVEVLVAVTGARPPDVAEQARRLTLAREAGELVDRRQQEGRRMPVDLVVDGEHRSPNSADPPAAKGQRARRSPQYTRMRFSTSSASTFDFGLIAVPHQGQWSNWRTVSPYAELPSLSRTSFTCSAASE